MSRHYDSRLTSASLQQTLAYTDPVLGVCLLGDQKMLLLRCLARILLCPRLRTSLLACRNCALNPDSYQSQCRFTIAPMTQSHASAELHTLRRLRTACSVPPHTDPATGNRASGEGYNRYLADFAPDLAFLSLLLSSASLCTKYSRESLGTSVWRHSLIAPWNCFPISMHAVLSSAVLVHTATLSPALRRLCDSHRHTRRQHRKRTKQCFSHRPPTSNAK